MCRRVSVSEYVATGGVPIEALCRSYTCILIWRELLLSWRWSCSSGIGVGGEAVGVILHVVDVWRDSWMGGRPLRLRTGGCVCKRRDARGDGRCAGGSVDVRERGRARQIIL
jgi:hypothetical protein